MQESTSKPDLLKKESDCGQKPTENARQESPQTNPAENGTVVVNKKDNDEEEKAMILNSIRSGKDGKEKRSARTSMVPVLQPPPKVQANIEEKSMYNRLISLKKLRRLKRKQRLWSKSKRSIMKCRRKRFLLR